jgi:hypothetical protein
MDLDRLPDARQPLDYWLPQWRERLPRHRRRR